MINLPEQIAEARRELAMRKKVYPRFIQSGKLDAGDAARQIDVMEAIVATLTRLDYEQRQLPLFTVV